MNEALTHDFQEGAPSPGFVGLTCHRSVGGLQTSLYNVVTDQTVDVLVDSLTTSRSSMHEH